MPLTRRSMLTGLATVLGTSLATAEAWPERPIRLVIPYAPGGPTDVLGRVLAEHLGRALQQSVMTENRPGAAGVLAMAEVARTAPDGYTLLMGDMNLAVSPALHKALPFDPVRSFSPIGLVATAPLLVLVPHGSAARDMRGLVAQARQLADKPLAYASAGIGSPMHLIPEVLKSQYGLKLTHVPFAGAGPALMAVAAGHAQLTVTGLSGARGLIEARKVRPLAITGPQRAPALPDVPTLTEAGTPLPEADVGSWWALLAPAGLPAPLAARLNAALHAALATPEAASRLAALNFVPAPGSREALRAWVASEAGTWGAVLKGAGIRPE